MKVVEGMKELEGGECEEGVVCVRVLKFRDACFRSSHALALVALLQQVHQLIDTIGPVANL
jgi:hypothetical protein